MRTRIFFAVLAFVATFGLASPRLAFSDSQNQFLYSCVDPMGMILILYADGPGKAVMYRILPLDADYRQNMVLMHYNLPDRTVISSVKADPIDPNYMHFKFSVRNSEGWRFRGELIIDSATPSDASLDVDSEHPSEDGGTTSTHLSPRLKCDYKLRIKNPYRAAT